MGAAFVATAFPGFTARAAFSAPGQGPCCGQKCGNNPCGTKGQCREGTKACGETVKDKCGNVGCRLQCCYNPAKEQCCAKGKDRWCCKWDEKCGEEFGRCIACEECRVARRGGGIKACCYPPDERCCFSDLQADCCGPGQVCRSGSCLCPKTKPVKCGINCCKKGQHCVRGECVRV